MPSATDPRPVISSDNLKISYAVNVTSGKGQPAFQVAGEFDLASAMHPAMTYAAQDDFELLLIRCVVNPAKIIMAQFMGAVQKAEQQGGSVWQNEATVDPKTKPSRSRPVQSSEEIGGVEKAVSESADQTKPDETPVDASAPA